MKFKRYLKVLCAIGCLCWALESIEAFSQSFPVDVYILVDLTGSFEDDLPVK